MKKMFCVQTIVLSLLLAGFGVFNTAAADETKQLKESATPEAATEDTAVPEVQSQSYSVVIESKVGEDGKRVQTKKVWKDGVLVEDEEKTVEGTEADGDTAIELDGQIAPGIILRSERSGDLFDDIDPNLSQDQVIGQMMSERFNAMRQRQIEIMKQLGFGPMPGVGYPRSVSIPCDYELGAAISPITDDVAAQLGLNAGEGIVILGAVTDSAAQKAGLQKYDILTKIGDQTLNIASLAEILNKTGDEPTSIEFYRNGKLQTGTITLQKRTQPFKSEYYLGASIIPVSEEAAAQLGIPEGKGVLIQSVLPNSPAFKSGLQHYDILVKLGETTVGDFETIGKTLDANGDKPIKIEFLRKGKIETAELVPEKRPTEPEAVPLAMPSNTQENFGANEKIRVVRPGMIIPAPNAATEPTEEISPNE